MSQHDPESDMSVNRKRVALVIGNSAYQHAPALPNPTCDAQAMAKMLQIDLKKTGYTVESALLNLRNQKCKVFDREVLPQESVKKVNDIYKTFKLICPNSIPRKVADMFAV